MKLLSGLALALVLSTAAQAQTPEYTIKVMPPGGPTPRR